MNNGVLLFIGIAVFLLYKKASDLKDDIKQGAEDLLHNGQDTLANSGLGTFAGLRTVEASNAAAWIKAQPWLRFSYYNWLFTNGYPTRYNLDQMGAIAAADTAQQIIDSNFRIFDNTTLEFIAAHTVPGWLVGEANPDNPEKATQAIFHIQNQVQALEVLYYYHLYTNKDLANGLQWLPNEHIVQVAYHLKSIPTGAFEKNPDGSNGELLTNLPTP